MSREAEYRGGSQPVQAARRETPSTGEELLYAPQHVEQQGKPDLMKRGEQDMNSPEQAVQPDEVKSEAIYTATDDLDVATKEDNRDQADKVEPSKLQPNLDVRKETLERGSELACLPGFAEQTAKMASSTSAGKSDTAKAEEPPQRTESSEADPKHRSTSDSLVLPVAEGLADAEDTPVVLPQPNEDQAPTPAQPTNKTGIAGLNPPDITIATLSAVDQIAAENGMPEKETALQVNQICYETSHPSLAPANRDDESTDGGALSGKEAMANADMVKDDLSKVGDEVVVQPSPIKPNLDLLVVRTAAGLKSDGTLSDTLLRSNRALTALAGAIERTPTYKDTRVDAKEQLAGEEEAHGKAVRAKIKNYIQYQVKEGSAKLRRLRDRYCRLHHDWKVHCERLDRIAEMRESQRRPPLSASISNPNASLTSAAPVSSGHQSSLVEESSGSLLATSMTRANRRNTQSAGFAGFGDAVRSEAEFLEILASLGNADMQDPSARAARTTAVEPEMAINPHDDHPLRRSYDDDNGHVANPEQFYLSDFDPDFWSEEEKATFERRYALYPKQFGKIAAALPLKTPGQCVKYYYSTKKLPGYDYKTLSASRSRDRRRKSRVKPKKGRGSALMADLKGDEGEDEDGGSPVEELASRRQGGARSRVSTLPASSEMETVSEEVTSFEAPVSRKRRVEESEIDESKQSRSKTARRGKYDRRGRLVVEEMGTTIDSAQTIGSQATQQVDDNFAAAEALEALAEASTEHVETFPSAGKKRKPQRPVLAKVQGVSSDPSEESSKRSRQSTSSYWSVAERTEFLRSLAVFGKAWDSIAENLKTKSAAQARNYFVRNAEDAELVEAVSLARQHADLSLEERKVLANEFLQARAMLAPGITERDGEVGAGPNLRVEESAKGPKGGLNISSLLNTVTDDERRASARHWLEKEQSDDDTEDEDAPHMERSTSIDFPHRSTSVHHESGHLMDDGMRQRTEYGMYDRQAPTSMMPPPSTLFARGEYGRQRFDPGYSSMLRYHGRGSLDFPQPPLTVPGSSHAQSVGYPSAVHIREPSVYHGSTLSAPPLPEYARTSRSPTSMPIQGGAGPWKRGTPSSPDSSHRLSSWPSGYSGMHLSPPSRQPVSDWRTSESRSVFAPARPATSPASVSTVAEPSLHSPRDSFGYNRPPSSESRSTSSIRSLSPHPPPQLPRPSTFLPNLRRPSE